VQKLTHILRPVFGFGLSGRSFMARFSGLEIEPYIVLDLVAFAAAADLGNHRRRGGNSLLYVASGDGLAQD
jgi:hypothetical protein